ncbi:DUF2945 domain-containing protein [Komarekiella sp. 'clone 1']|uniref:DUF2945 domain-containing protein n=1 Tax=Komarekiella delphini-convector SJRDD-AB1 TaxID=2593771 RepID=A0AA40T4V0_9NOST|nr:DUF2945 domain-containing protein [Komarekiella delphini-convector SJRDD-AB1]
MAEQFKTGDKVEWKALQGVKTGEVVQKLTSPTNLRGNHIAASVDNPEYVVKSDQTRNEAAHKPDTLKKVEE